MRDADFLPKSVMQLPKPGSRYYYIPAHMVITSPFYSNSAMKSTLDLNPEYANDITQLLRPGEMTKTQLCAHAGFSAVTVNAAMKSGNIVPDRYVGVQAVFSETTITEFIRWVHEDRRIRAAERKRQHLEAKAKTAIPLTELRKRNADLKKMQKEYSYLYRHPGNFTYEESN